MRVPACQLLEEQETSTACLRGRVGWSLDSPSRRVGNARSRTAADHKTKSVRSGHVGLEHGRRDTEVE